MHLGNWLVSLARVVDDDVFEINLKLTDEKIDKKKDVSFIRCKCQ